MWNIDSFFVTTLLFVMPAHGVRGLIFTDLDTSRGENNYVFIFFFQSIRNGRVRRKRFSVQV